MKTRAKPEEENPMLIEKNVNYKFIIVSLVPMYVCIGTGIYFFTKIVGVFTFCAIFYLYSCIFGLPSIKRMHC